VRHLLVVNEEGELVRTRLMVVVLTNNDEASSPVLLDTCLVVVLANNDEASSPVLRLINTIERIY